MVKVITYGTFDLFHQGHYNLLKRAKALGDYLIVGVTSDYFNKCRGKFNVQEDLMTRIRHVEESGFADEIVVEEYFGQKIDDIKKYNADIFTVGSDWIGHFDYLNEYCKVQYLERTKGISSTELRNTTALRLGILGNEQILDRFLRELSYVSGIEPAGICPNRPDLPAYDIPVCGSVEELLEKADAVYINLPLSERPDAIRKALDNGKHVITEFPFCPDYTLAKQLIAYAKTHNLVIMEGLKTAYCPAFTKMISLVRSGLIGNILSVDARFTQILGDQLPDQLHIAGGAVRALLAYPLLAIFKLLGTNYKEVICFSHNRQDTDIFTKVQLLYPNAIATGTVAIDAKAEGNLVITGTKGYVYVPAPWWKTELFEVRYEDINKNTKYFYKFDGEGLRYELVEFVRSIRDRRQENPFFTTTDMLEESRLIDHIEHMKNIYYF